MSRVAADVDVLEVAEGIAGPGVLGAGVVVEIELPCLGIEDDVLEHGAEAPRGGVDLGFAQRVEADDLGVAAALDVEDAAVGPAVLVVADQGARGVRREGRLAGAGEAEEQGAVRRIRAVVRAAVHAQHTALRHQEVHHAEHRLLHLAGVLAAPDQGQMPLQVEGDEGRAVRAVGFRIGQNARDVDDGVVGHEVREFRFVRRAQEHVADEQAVPGPLADHPHVQAAGRIGARETVEDEQVPIRGRGQHLAVEAVEVFRRERLVHRTPVHQVGRRRAAHDEAVVRRPPRVLAGRRDERPSGGNRGLAAANRFFVEPGHAETPVNDAPVG